MSYNRNVIKNTSVKTEESEQLVDISTDIIEDFIRTEVQRDRDQEEFAGQGKDRSLEENIEGLKDQIKREHQVELEAEREILLTQARQEIEVLKKEAEEEAFEKGHARGMEAGYQSILEEAQEEAEEIKTRMMEDSKTYAEDYFKKNRENIIDLSLSMAESIVHYEIERSDTGLIDLIDRQIDAYQEIESMIIRCHPKGKEEIKDNLDRLEEKSPTTKFFLVTDSNLDEHDLVLENDDQIVDLNIKQQIESIRNTIRNVE